jgi:cation-transporting ATPase E
VSGTEPSAAGNGAQPPGAGAPPDSAAPQSVEAPTSAAPAIAGLTSAEVSERIAAGQTNVTLRPGGRTTWDIVRGNLFTFFNLILGILFAAMLLFGSWKDALFGWIIFINAGIGIVQELRAKIALDRLSLLTAPVTRVIRDGAEREIRIDEVVLDDVIVVAAGDQIVADGQAIECKSLEVDESLLTGESLPVIKACGDEFLSGSFVVAGSGMYRTTAVGGDSYAQRLTREGKQYTRLHSDLVAGINKVLRVIGIGIVPVAALMVWAQFRLGATMEEGVTNTVAALVAMVPQGLVLLTSIAFAVSAVTLARRKVLVRELPAVEGLARVDVLCIDKTGTITEPRPAFERFEAVDKAAGDPDPGRDALALEVLGAMAAAAPVRNSTLDAIGQELPDPSGWTVEDQVAFSSARKWSAVRIAGRGSWVLGAPEIIADGGSNSPSASRARSRAAELADEGLRVLLLSHSDEALNGEDLPDKLEPAGLVILSERVRSDAPETLAYFRREGVQIKVISGDNPATVATIAAKAGVPGADKAVDARTLPEGDELAEMMENNTVFGRVHPDQKRAMVAALQSRGHVVAMTGDGVNDVLALKKADMGIAMGTGTAAARAVAQLVLVDSHFATLPGVVAEGRRVTANIERVASLFTTKSVWAAALAIAVAAVGVSYPILPRHLTLIDSLTIGVPAFFLALAPNARRFIPGFVYRVARFVIPTGILTAITVLASYLLMREMGASVAQAQVMETIVFSAVGLRVIAAIERPVRGWRLGLILAMAVIFGAAFVVPLTQDFFALTLPGWRIIAVGAATCVFAWFFVGLGWRIAKHFPFWRDEAARVREA